MDCFGVSIIIPVYNREHYLGQAIESILSQEFSGSIEIIISDDGSTDSSLSIAESYNDSRIRILRKPIDCKSQGASSTRNRALKVATMPYICFLDSDDYQLPDFLKSMTNFLEDTNLDFCFCRTNQLIEGNGLSITKQWSRSIILSADIKYLALTRSRIVNTNSFLFCARVFDKVGCFNEEYSNSEDIDLWIRISELCKGGFVDFYGTVRRSHDGEQLTKNSSSLVKDCTLLVYERALERVQNENDKFRCYILKYSIIALNKKSVLSHRWNQFKLMSRSPKYSFYHALIVIISCVDRFCVKKK